MTALPQTIHAALADPDVREIELPAGCYQDTVQVTRSDLRIYGHDTTIMGGHNGPKPCYVWSPFTGSQNWVEKEYSATGTVTPDVDSLAVESGADLQPGDVVLVRLGVSTHDPAEPESQVYATVQSFDGTTVVFDMPLGRQPSTWASYDDLKLEVASSQHNKVGPREWTGSYWRRGRGFDHGITYYLNRQPTSDVLIEGLKVKWDPAAATVAGADSFSIRNVMRAHFRDIKVQNPRARSFHIHSGIDSGVDGLTIRGDGITSTGRRSPCVTCWGGENNYARNITAVGKDLLLTDCEVGTTNMLIDRVRLRTVFTPGLIGETHFGVHGVHPGFRIRDVVLDTPSATLTAGTNPDGIVYENIAFERPEVPGWLHFYMRGLWDGTIRIGRRTFGPLRRYAIEVDVTQDGQIIPHPQGLIAGGQVILSTREGVREVSPDSIFTTNPGLVTLPLTENKWAQLPPGSYEDYRAALDSWKIRVWLESGAAPVRVRLEMDYYPLAGSATPSAGTSEIFGVGVEPVGT